MLRVGNWSALGVQAVSVPNPEERRRLWDAVEWADVPEPAREFVDFLEARLEAAERERDELKALCHDADQETMMYVAKAEAAESALAEARKALKALLADRCPPGCAKCADLYLATADLRAALAARPGEQQ